MLFLRPFLLIFDPLFYILSSYVAKLALRFVVSIPLFYLLIINTNRLVAKACKKSVYVLYQVWINILQ